MNNYFGAESAVNYEQKSLCVLLLDTSNSMYGKKLANLQIGVNSFYQEILHDSILKNRLELAIIAYGSRVEVLQNPELIDKVEIPHLESSGSTSMGEAINEAIDLIEARKSWYKMTGQPYYRPWIINITDGEPTDIPDIDKLGNKLRKKIDEKHFYMFNVGVDGADMELLQKLSSEKMPPAKLQGLKFSEFFQWLSASIQIVTASSDNEENITDLPTPENWMEGFQIE